MVIKPLPKRLMASPFKAGAFFQIKQKIPFWKKSTVNLAIWDARNSIWEKPDDQHEEIPQDFIILRMGWCESTGNNNKNIIIVGF